MSGSSIPMLPQIAIRVLPLATRSMKTSKSVPISEEYVKLSTPPSHHLSCLPPEVWLERPLYSTNDLLLALPPSGISLTHQHSIGCVAV